MVLPFVNARIVNPEGAVLIGQTANLQRKPYPCFWDLPGGKLESGEQPGNCIKREIQEELQVRVVSVKLVDVFHHTTGNFRPEYNGQIHGLGLCYDAMIEGDLKPTEQENVHYALPAELKTLKLTPWAEYYLRDLL